MKSKWTRTGCGTYREIRQGVFEVRWRPNGTKGPYLKRRIAGNTKEIRAMLAQQSEVRSRRKVGLAVNLGWGTAIEHYKTRLCAKKNTPDYVAKVLDLIDACREHCNVAHVDAVEPHQLGLWVDKFAVAGNSARTCNKKLSMVAAFFAFLAKRRLIPHNPAYALDHLPEQKKAPRELAPLEYAKVWSASEQEFRDLLDFLLITGARFSEVAKMKRTDISAAGVWTCQARKGRDFLRLQLSSYLLEVVLRQPKHADGFIWHRWVRAHPGSKKDHWSKPGARINVWWFDKVLAVRCERAKIPEFTAHALRHATATWAAANAQSTAGIQGLLGHADAATTQLYIDKVARQSGANVVLSAIESIRAKALKDLPA